MYGPPQDVSVWVGYCTVAVGKGVRTVAHRTVAHRTKAHQKYPLADNNNELMYNNE